MSDDVMSWRGIRFQSRVGTGQLWSLPTRLYFIELAVHTHPGAIFVYDHTRYPQNLVTILCASPEATSEPFPPADKHVTVPLERGCYVSYSHVPVGMSGVVTLGFSP